jgi:hypothetical protein
MREFIDVPICRVSLDRWMHERGERTRPAQHPTATGDEVRRQKGQLRGPPALLLPRVMVYSVRSIVRTALLLAIASWATTCTSSQPLAAHNNYTDPAGWSIEVPAGWHAIRFDTSNSGASASGTLISNVELPVPTIEPGLPIQTSGNVLPRDGVAVVVSTDDDRDNAQPPPDSLPAPPLSLSDFNEGSSTGGGPIFSFLWFDANGQPLIVSIKRGPDVSKDDYAALQAMIASLRLEDA